MQTDASKYAIGAVLLQDFGNGFLEQTEFISRKFTKAEDGWHASERELVAVVFALRKWIRYLLPSHFTVFTDHKNLQNLFANEDIKIGKLQRWVIFLQQFDFIAKYLTGKDNYIADYLSRDAETVQEVIRTEEKSSPTASASKESTKEKSFPQTSASKESHSINNEMLLIKVPTRVQKTVLSTPGTYHTLLPIPFSGRRTRLATGVIEEADLREQELNEPLLADSNFEKQRPTKPATFFSPPN